MKYSVFICDDDPGLTAGYVDEVSKIAGRNYDCQPTRGADALRASVSELLRRRRSVRVGRSYERRECLFDKKDILLVDYDLIHFDDDKAQHTGEGIGRLARVYSDCAVVVVFNQFIQFDFDLSLRGDLASHGDFNLNAELLTTPGLWNSPPWSGFRPWYWQVLSSAVDRQRAREDVFGCEPDRPIVDTVGMLAEDAMGLSDTAFGFLSPEANDFDGLRKITFDSFVSAAPGSDKGFGLSSGESAVVRFGATRIGRWLESEILGPQDVLVDVPHLLQRYPFLLGRDVHDLTVWNDTIHHTQRLRKEFDESYWFEPANCLSRPAVWCRRLEADKDFIRRRADFDYSEVPDIAFMEDSSVFDYISDATEFRAGFHNSFDRRFVKHFQEIRYGPQRRFAFTSEM